MTAQNLSPKGVHAHVYARARTTQTRTHKHIAQHPGAMQQLEKGFGGIEK